MLKHTLIILTFLIVFISCGEGKNPTNKINSKTRHIEVSNTEFEIECALTFINTYVDNSNKMNKSIEISDWVNSNSLTTKNFKTELKKIIDDAYEEDPELGLDFDPIFDAQDYPSEGFELESLDKKTNYLTVRGKDWPEFKLTMKVINENGNCLVDGCGVVNIPDSKRASR
ncbi:MAG: hypothetical protein V4622_13495 [Bacteroidota bacterium]